MAPQTIMRYYSAMCYIKSFQEKFHSYTYAEVSYTSSLNSSSNNLIIFFN